MGENFLDDRVARPRRVRGERRYRFERKVSLRAKAIIFSTRPKMGESLAKIPTPPSLERSKLLSTAAKF